MAGRTASTAKTNAIQANVITVTNSHVWRPKRGVSHPTDCSARMHDRSLTNQIFELVHLKYVRERSQVCEPLDQH